MNLVEYIDQNTSSYPIQLTQYLKSKAPKQLESLGNISILQNKTLAIFCSMKCPGSLILQTHDLAKILKTQEITVIAGFHSPIEEECLNVLLRGKQPIIICPARSIKEMRVPKELRKPINEGRILLLSPFDEKKKRNTKQTAIFRNEFVAALAGKIFISHAEKTSKTYQLCQKILSWEKPTYTFESIYNKDLIELGVSAISLEKVSSIDL